MGLDYVSRRTRRALSILFGASFLLNAGYAASADDLLFDPSIEVVLTPTRLQQRVADVPASVTAITHDTISRLGLRTVAEILRLVPGMIVGQASGNEYRINYHGTNGLIPRRMQVLVDGMPVYHTGYAEITWVTLPVAVDDIDRIEVTRSPSSASYGANSFLAVINIITRHPNDAPEIAVKGYVGSLSTADGLIIHSRHIGSTAVKMSLAHQENSGFDSNFLGNARRDGTRLDRVNVRTVTDLDDETVLDLQAAASRASLQSEFADANQITFPDKDLDEYFVLGTWSRHLHDHELQVKGYARAAEQNRSWRTCYPTIFFSEELRDLQAANPAYVTAILAGQLPSGGSPRDDALAQAVLSRVAALGEGALAPTCGDVHEDQSEYQYDLDVQDTWVISPQLRAVAGVGLRWDRYESDTFVNGDREYYSRRIFGTAEYKPTNTIVFNVGAMWEYEEHRTAGVDFSPRVALNYHLNQQQTLRFIYARAVRTPDALETDHDWNYYVTNLDPPYEGRSAAYFYHRATADGRVVPEKITSREISYYARWPQQALSWDLKLFEERLTDVIAEKLQFFDYHPSNDNSVRLRGVEMELEFRPTRHLLTRFAYAYVDNESTDFYERSLHARHSGSAIASYLWANASNATIAYYGSSPIGGFSYDRIDFILSKWWGIGDKGRLETSLIASYFTQPDNGFIVNETFSVANNYNDSTHWYAVIKYSY